MWQIIKTFVLDLAHQSNSFRYPTQHLKTRHCRILMYDSQDHTNCSAVPTRRSITDKRSPIGIKFHSCAPRDFRQFIVSLHLIVIAAAVATVHNSNRRAEHLPHCRRAIAPFRSERRGRLICKAKGGLFELWFSVSRRTCSLCFLFIRRIGL